MKKYLVMACLCAPMELLLKHGRDAKFELPIEAYKKVFHSCIAEVGDEYIYSMLEYTSDLADKSVGENLYKFIQQVFTDKQETIMTYREVLKQEGLKEGLIQGIREGMQAKAEDIARGMLQKGMPIEESIAWTGLNRQAIENIKQKQE